MTSLWTLANGIGLIPNFVVKSAMLILSNCFQRQSRLNIFTQWVSCLFFFRPNGIVLVVEVEDYTTTTSPLDHPYRRKVVHLKVFLWTVEEYATYDGFLIEIEKQIHSGFDHLDQTYMLR